MSRWLLVVLVCFTLGFTATACEKEGDGDGEKSEESKPTADAWDDSAYEEGKEYTATLMFWMMGKCAQGDTMGYCAHFDAAEHERVVFWHGEEEAGSEEWTQSEFYEVTFTHSKDPNNTLNKGTLVSVK